MKTTTKNDILGYTTAIIASLIPAIIFSKYLEAFIFVVSHTLIRPQYKRQYHHIIPAVCRTITGLIAFFGVSFILPLELSLLSAIPINYLISWVGHTKSTSDYYERKYFDLKEELNSNKEFNTDTCSLKELVKRCEELNFSKEKTELAIEFFINKTKQSELADRFCIEENSISKRKLRIKKELNKKD